LLTQNGDGIDFAEPAKTKRISVHISKAELWIVTGSLSTTPAKFAFEAAACSYSGPMTFLLAEGES
jgi:hypothetical protein